MTLLEAFWINGGSFVFGYLVVVVLCAVIAFQNMARLPKRVSPDPEPLNTERES